MAAFKQATVGRDTVVELRLTSSPLPVTAFDIVPPASGGRLPLVTEAQRMENNRRLAAEDSIRHIREAAMPIEAWRGNHEVIRRFLDEAPNREMARRLLDMLSAKDLRDVELDVLRDNAVSITDTDAVYLRYVLCPRVENEWLTPYKAPLRQLMAEVGSPSELALWCRQNIVVEREWRSTDGCLHGPNPQQLRMAPLSVYRTRKTDELGLKIFFVAAARSMGWPARINEVDGRLQYYEQQRWHDVDFGQSAQTKPAQPTRQLELTYNIKSPYVDDPAYYTHFTLSRIENGRAQLLTYPEGATWQHDFAQGIPLEPESHPH